MADAKVIGNRVLVQLTLSEEETALIYTLIMNTGGSGSGPRGYATSVTRALEEVAGEINLYDKYEEYSELISESAGSIYFVEKPVVED